MINYNNIDELEEIFGKIRTTNRLKELRNSKGLTLKSIATVIGRSEPIVRKWEKNLYNPRAEDLVKLSMFYEIPIEELLMVNKNKQKN